MRGLNEYHHLVNYPFPFRKHGENRRAATAAKRRTAVGLLLRGFENDSQFTDNVLLHMSAILRRVGITVPTNGFTVCMMHGNSG